MSCYGPAHYNQQFASTTQFWTGTDTESHFKKNCSDPEKFTKLKSLGWVDSVPLTYIYNSEGFRDQEFTQEPAGIALGCSHTEGVGVYAKDTWPAQLQNMLSKKIWNLGVGGASSDTCYRLLDFWISNLKVEFVCYAVPPISRYEVFSGSRWTNVLPSETVPSWLSNFHRNYLAHEQNSELNRRKNLQAMHHICTKHNVPFYVDLLEVFYEPPVARDLLHFGAGSNQRIATKFFHDIKGN